MSPVEHEFHQPCTGGKGELETMGQLTRNEVFTLAVQKYSDAVYRAAIHNSRCNLSVLQESPFTDQGSVVEIFTDLTVWMGIRKVIDTINANAAA